VKVFLPEKMTMIDLEMSGVNVLEDEILQIAMIKLKLEGNQYKEMDRREWFLHTDSQPTRKFHKEHLSEIFKKCNESNLTTEQATAEIDAWLGEWKHSVPVGDCIPTDIYFLYLNDIIKMSGFENDEPVKGTFDHEFFDLNAPKIFAREKLKEKFEVPGVDKENAHNALVDCENQLLELNAYLVVLLEEIGG
jgi:oligoribonuclease (3'-5' exoribonuclease)